MSCLTKIKFNNSCDLGGISYVKGYSNILYLDVDIGEPTYEQLEEGQEDGEKNFIPHFRKLIKHYTFHTVVSEYLFDCLNFIGLHDNIFIQLKNGEESKCLTFKCELAGWRDNGSIADVKIDFTTNYMIKSHCCTAETYQITECVSCQKSIKLKPISVLDPAYTAPVSSKSMDKKPYLVYDTDIFKLQLLEFDYRISAWAIYGSKYNYICYTDLGVTYNLYYRNGYYYYYNKIKSLTAIGLSVTIKGLCLPNTYVIVYHSTDGINYTTDGIVYDANKFEQLGKIKTYSAGANYFKFLMYDKNCNYGYSNIERITL